MSNKLIDANTVLAQLEDRQGYLVKEWGYKDHYTRGFEEAVSIVRNSPGVSSAGFENVYSKKYVIETIKECREHNPAYENLVGGYCFPAYLRVGDRGWILCVENDSLDLIPHRLHTSIIKSVICEKGIIIVESENTRIVLREIRDT